MAIESEVYLHNIMPLLHLGEYVQLSTRYFIWVSGFLAHWYSIHLQDDRYEKVSTYNFKLMCFAYF